MWWLQRRNVRIANVYCGGEPRLSCRVLTRSINETTNKRHARISCRWFHVEGGVLSCVMNVSETQDNGLESFHPQFPQYFQGPEHSFLMVAWPCMAQCPSSIPPTTITTQAGLAKSSLVLLPEPNKAPDETPDETFD